MLAPPLLLADYDNLATHVPNLVESTRRPHPKDGVRLFQEGAQKIVGFDFRASLTMDMVEVVERGAQRPTQLTFSLVESAMFASFDGEWQVRPYSRRRSRDDPTRFDFRTRLTYVVNITPRELLPPPHACAPSAPPVRLSPRVRTLVLTERVYACALGHRVCASQVGSSRCRRSSGAYERTCP